MNWGLAWGLWLVALVVSFGIMEGFALASPTGITLSRWTYNATVAFPLLPWIGGVLAGALAVHFWWHWNPA